MNLFSAMCPLCGTTLYLDAYNLSVLCSCGRYSVEVQFTTSNTTSSIPWKGFEKESTKGVMQSQKVNVPAVFYDAFTDEELQP